MDILNEIQAEWINESQSLMHSPFFSQLMGGKLTSLHYKVLLREIYYNTRENPQIYSLFMAHLKGNKRNICQRVLRHAASEFGHHFLALKDLQNLGVDTTEIPRRRPLPTTEILTAFGIYHIQHSNPLAYLGYVYHLEMLPARNGNALLKVLQQMEIPENACSFIKEHAEVDSAHTHLMEKNFIEAIETQADLDAVIYGAKATCRLHGIMLQGILDDVTKQENWGVNHLEYAEASQAIQV